jgi:hypothetical protein
MVDYKVFSWDYRELCRQHITPESIADAARVISRARIPSPSSTNENDRQESVLSAENIIVDLSPMHYGMQEKNPFDFIKFYSKHRPNGELHAINSKLGYSAKWCSA